MSRRFGRNQRKNLRGELSLLRDESTRWQEAAQMANGLQKHTSQRLREAESVIDAVRRELGPHFIALPAERIFGAPLRLSLNPNRSNRFGMMANGSQVTMEMMTVSHNQNTLDNYMHVRVVLADEIVAYAISVPALYHSDERTLVENMASEMAPALLRCIREAKKS